MCIFVIVYTCTYMNDFNQNQCLINLFQTVINIILTINVCRFVLVYAVLWLQDEGTTWKLILVTFWIVFKVGIFYVHVCVYCSLAMINGFDAMQFGGGNIVSMLIQAEGGSNCMIL